MVDDKPCLHLCARGRTAADKLKALLREHDAKVLNVARPRTSNEPGVGEQSLSYRLHGTNELVNKPVHVHILDNVNFSLAQMGCKRI